MIIGAVLPQVLEEMGATENLRVRRSPWSLGAQGSHQQVRVKQVSSYFAFLITKPQYGTSTCFCVPSMVQFCFLFLINYFCLCSPAITIDKHITGAPGIDCQHFRWGVTVQHSFSVNTITTLDGHHTDKM